MVVIASLSACTSSSAKSLRYGSFCEPERASRALVQNEHQLVSSQLFEIPLPPLVDVQKVPPLVFQLVDKGDRKQLGINASVDKNYWIMKYELSGAQAASILGYNSYSDYLDNLQKRLSLPHQHLASTLMEELRGNPSRPCIGANIDTAMILSYRITQIVDQKYFVQIPTLSQWIVAEAGGWNSDRIVKDGNWGQEVGSLQSSWLPSDGLLTDVRVGEQSLATGLKNMWGNVSEIVVLTQQESCDLNSKFYQDHGALGGVTRMPILVGGGFASGSLHKYIDQSSVQKRFESFKSYCYSDSWYIFSRYPQHGREIDLANIDAGYRFVLVSY